MQGQNQQRTSRSPFGSAPYRWNSTAGNAAGSPSIGANGVVYSIWNYFYVLAQNGSTGDLIWDYAAPGQGCTLGSGTPSIDAAGAIFFGCGNDFFALNGSTGAQLWTYKAGGLISTVPAIGADGTVYFGCSNVYGKHNQQNFYALNGTSGAFRWLFTADDDIASSPNIGNDGTVYFGSTDSKVYAVNGNSGALSWSYQADGAVVSSPALGFDGTVYVGSWEAAFNHMFALNGSTGQLRWMSQVASGYGSPAVGADGTVFFGGNGTTYYAVDGDTGSVIWSQTTGQYPISTPPSIASDGVVIFCTDVLFADNATTGQGIWTSSGCSPAIAADGTLFTGYEFGTVLALNGSTGAAYPPTSTSTK